MKSIYIFFGSCLFVSLLLSSVQVSRAFDLDTVLCKNQLTCASSVDMSPNAAVLRSLQVNISHLKDLLAQLLLQKSQGITPLPASSFATASQTVQEPKSTAMLCASPTGSYVQVYELLNGRTQKHFYTTDSLEKDRFIKDLGFTDLGVVAEIASTKVVGTVALQRFKNANTGAYLLASEANAVNVPSGFMLDTVLGYISPKAASDTAGLRHYVNAQGDNYYSADSSLDATITSLGYTYKLDENAVCMPKPYISQNIVLAVTGKTAVLKGSGFGTNPKNPNYKVILQKSLSERVAVSSDSSSVISWTDREIKFKTPAGVKSGYTAYVTKGNILKNSNEVPVRVYTFSEYSIISKDDITGNPLPLDIAFDNNHTLWVNSEFGRGVESFDTITKTTKYYQDIQPTSGIFWYNKGLTSITAGEDVDVAANGDIWYTQGGDLYSGLGYGRVVQLNPTTGKQRCYSVPNGGAGLIGVVYDEKTGVVWAGIASLGATTEKPNYILSFKPKTFTDAMASCTYDYKTPAPAPVCIATASDGCFKKYTLPKPLFDAAHLVVGPDSNIWFTSFYANTIGKLTVQTGKVESYPLPLSARGQLTKGTKTPWVLGSGPWQLVFDTQGQLWIGEYFDDNFIKFDPAGGILCSKLSANGTNPCMKEYDIILYPNSSFDKEGVHTVDLDAQGNLWFVTGTYPVDVGVGYLGVIDPKGELSLFPPLPDLGIQGGGSGIVVDKKTGDIWFNQYYEKKIGHLTYIK